MRTAARARRLAAEAVAAERGEVVHAVDVMERTGLAVSEVVAALAALASRGIIERVGPGRYRAVHRT